MPIEYLSFQRPPSRQVRHGETVTIAPLIANDLRDEPHSPEDSAGTSIQVAWVWVSHSGQRAATSDQDQNERGKQRLPIEFSLAKTEESILWMGVQSSWKSVSVIAPSANDIARLQRGAVSKGQGSGTLRIAMWVDQMSSPISDLQADRPNKPFKTGKGQGDVVTSRGLSHRLSVKPKDVSTRSAAGDTVFVPVLSPAIEVLSNETASPKAEKFVENSRFLRYESIEGRDGYIEVLEQNGFELDKHIWDASFPLKALLNTRAPMSIITDPAAARTWQGVQDVLDDQERDLVVLELGAGTGSLSLYLKELFANVQGQQRTVRIVATDLGESLDFTRENFKLNAGNERATPAVSLHTIALDWYEQQTPAELTTLLESSPDPNVLLLASDCSYNPDTYDAFASLVSRLMQQPSHRTACVISKKHRHEDEKSLWDKLDQHGLETTVIDGVHYKYNVGDGSSDAEHDDVRGNWGIFAVERRFE